MVKSNRLLSICMALLMLISITLVSTAKSTPEEDLMELISKSQKLRQYHQRAEMSFNVTADYDDPTTAFVTDLYNAITLNYDIMKKGDQIQGTFTYNYEKEELLTVNFYQDDEMITLSVPEAHGKVFYLKWDEVGQLVENITPSMKVSTIEFKDYMKLIDLKKSKEFNLIDKIKYYNQIKDFLKGRTTKEKKRETVTIQTDNEEKEYDCNVYSLDVESIDAMKLCLSLTKTVIEDQEVRNFMIAKYSELISIALKNEDYKKLDLRKVQITVSRLEFPEKYDATMDEVKLGIQQYETFLQILENMMDSHFSIKFYVDRKSDKIPKAEAKWVSRTEHEGQVLLEFESTVTMTTLTYKGVKINKPELTETNSLNVATITAETMPALMDEVQSQIMTTMTTNSAAQRLMDKVAEYQMMQMERRKMIEEQLMKELESGEIDFELDVEEKTEKIENPK